MLLAKWLDQQKWTNRRLAEKIGTTPEAVRLYRAGARRPGPVVQARIAAVTNNAVTEDDLLRAYAAYNPRSSRMFNNTPPYFKDV